MQTWLSSVLTRGTHPPPDLPWRPATPADRAAAARDVRDGLLHPVLADVVVGSGTVLDARLRAGALALLVPRGTVLVGDGAAWVHLGSTGPAPATVRCVGARASSGVVVTGPAGTLAVRVSRAPRPVDGVGTLAGLTLTDPARTVRDLARHDPEHAARVHAGLRALGLEAGDAPVAGARRRVSPRPGSSAGRP